MITTTHDGTPLRKSSVYRITTDAGKRLARFKGEWLPASGAAVFAVHGDEFFIANCKCIEKCTKEEALTLYMGHPSRSLTVGQDPAVVSAI